MSKKKVKCCQCEKSCRWLVVCPTCQMINTKAECKRILKLLDNQLEDDRLHGGDISPTQEHLRELRRKIVEGEKA